MSLGFVDVLPLVLMYFVRTNYATCHIPNTTSRIPTHYDYVTVQ